MTWGGVTWQCRLDCQLGFGPRLPLLPIPSIRSDPVRSEYGPWPCNRRRQTKPPWYTKDQIMKAGSADWLWAVAALLPCCPAARPTGLGPGLRHCFQPLHRHANAALATVASNTILTTVIGCLIRLGLSPLRFKWPIFSRSPVKYR